MKTFLQLVAHDLYAKIGNDLSRTAIVFPNKRASLFFNEYLAAETDRPLWSPAYVSISELFRQLSPLKSGDPIRLVCELYKVFREETHSEETLDDFYFWGELLISDFDDVDKNLVDADKLFSNALKTGRNDVHLGTAFHLAELCGVKIQHEAAPAIGTLGTQSSPLLFYLTHTRTRGRVRIGH